MEAILLEEELPGEGPGKVGVVGRARGCTEGLHGATNQPM